MSGRQSLETICRGPFRDETELYRSLIFAFSQHIQLLPLEHHKFFAPVPVKTEYSSFSAYRSATDLWNDFVTVGCKIDSSENRLDYYIYQYGVFAGLFSVNELYTLVYGEVSEGISSLFEQQRAKEDVVAMRALFAEDDQSPAYIKRQETEYFNAVGWDRNAISKTLTVMCELNKKFVADSRLWRWLMKAVPPSGWIEDRK
ncbi:hypothetical protein AJ79_09223 [Helicocarpus griseus UAMH5409]|uniref:Uncharacterized protein n=1 Tax=Helicocarpus griseus UAMH5409 TaxID=1447875 RepID=A0A2B7WL58_9EURO|nr:hypothetical protein AJ79_09223 [Helicocarpus griseus UAMH5409]